MVSTYKLPIREGTWFLLALDSLGSLLDNHISSHPQANPNQARTGFSDWAGASPGSLSENGSCLQRGLRFSLSEKLSVAGIQAITLFFEKIGLILIENCFG